MVIKHGSVFVFATPCHVNAVPYAHKEECAEVGSERVWKGMGSCEAELAAGPEAGCSIAGVSRLFGHGVGGW